MLQTGIPLVNIVAWAAVVACIVATVICATKYTKRYARLFTSLTLFALGWALLLPYYGLQPEKGRSKDLSEILELLPAYSGLLLALAGGALAREAAVRQTHRDPGIGRQDVWVLHALYAMVLPHVLAVPGAPDISHKYHSHLVMILGTGFTILGFLSILRGLKNLIGQSPTNRWSWPLFKVITISYIIVELVFTAYLLPDIHRQMPPIFKWPFAFFKVIFSGLFLFLVVRHTRPRPKQPEPAVDTTNTQDRDEEVNPSNLS